VIVCFPEQTFINTVCQKFNTCFLFYFVLRLRLATRKTARNFLKITMERAIPWIFIRAFLKKSKNATADLFV